MANTQQEFENLGEVRGSPEKEEQDTFYEDDGNIAEAVGQDAQKSAYLEYEREYQREQDSLNRRNGFRQQDVAGDAEEEAYDGEEDGESEGSLGGF